MSSRAKRVRYNPSSNPTVDPSLSDAEDDRTAAASASGGVGIGPAERKRELERNRRNLVNSRFAELEAQLSKLPGAPKRVYRRIDKEVVLKDATKGLASQQRDLELATTRIGNMTHEIGTLRSEKLELRHDKAYLHKELANARTENKTLANDNMLLWQALCKSGAVKSSLPTALSKIPVNIIMGNDHQQTASTANTNNNNSNNNSPPQHTLLPPAALEQSPVAANNVGLKQQDVELPSDSEFFRNLSVDLNTAATAAANANDAGDNGAGEDFLKGVVGDAFSSIHHPLTSTALLTHFALENTGEMRLNQATDSHPDIAPCG